jgi:lysozyme
MSGRRLIDMLILHEGKRHHVYECTSGKLTIGVGRNLEDLGLSDGEIDFLLRNDLMRVQSELAANVPCFLKLSETRQDVLMDMCFNLGISRLLQFKNMLTALEIGDYIEAAAEMLDSRWAKQVGERATRLAKMMATDEWYE